IAGLEKPLSGHIRLPQDARVCFCFQEDRLLPWKTVLQNVALAAKSEEDADGMLVHQWDRNEEEPAHE
ncbi:MAG: hypothetical protein IIV20_02960, partial [Bacteroidaceae bacterium]|nr:hypothetical protein [Bacteroidaceae bacterium]